MHISPPKNTTNQKKIRVNSHSVQWYWGGGWGRTHTGRHRLCLPNWKVWKRQERKKEAFVFYFTFLQVVVALDVSLALDTRSTHCWTQIQPNTVCRLLVWDEDCCCSELQRGRGAQAAPACTGWGLWLCPCAELPGAGSAFTLCTTTVITHHLQLPGKCGPLSQRTSFC